MPATTLTVTHEVGLHARPASVFVKTANQFGADIRVRNKTGNSEWVDGKSILSVLTLGVEQDHVIELEAEGEDSETAMATLTELVHSNFEAM